MKITTKNLWSFLLFVLPLSVYPQLKPVQYVDPFIGTGDHGHVFIGAHVPFGAVQAGPTNYIKGWDWCSGYHYSDSILTGFSQTHLSGTGIGDLGDVHIMPYTGNIQSEPGTPEKPLSGYATLYKHSDEVAKAGYYSIMLRKYGIKAQITATERVACYKFNYPGTQQARLAIDLGRGIGWDAPAETHLQKIDDYTLVGYRHSKGWAKDQRLYFAIKLSQPLKEMKLWADKQVTGTTAGTARIVQSVITLHTNAQKAVEVRIGISPVSEKNALANIQTETATNSFEQLVVSAQNKWNKELSCVHIQTKNLSDIRTFYTALYHAFTAPALFNDNNRDYRGTDKKVYTQAKFNNYSVFSLWDTYRAAHPLYTLVQPQRVADMVQSMLAIYQQQGKLPVWALMGCETDCMVGYSAIPVIADAIFKGFGGIDTQLAFEAMIASSSRDELGLKQVRESGFIPADKEYESVSKALEYGVSDWCIAQLAKQLGNRAAYETYAKRANAYKLYYDNQTGFLRPKLSDGSFKSPFNPLESIHEKGDYTEGNAWQYAWLVPQDPEGLIKLYGGEEKFLSRLDSLFVVTGDMGKLASADISGLIGQYAHGNEPSHHIAYLYPFAGQQWKTAEEVRYIMRELYHDKPAGLSGNEDCGQMSAWYILSSMGFYPVNPAAGCFVFGSPLFDELSIRVKNDKTFTIKAHNNNEKNIYIQSAMLNGEPYTKTYISYADIMKGGMLEFVMGNQPNKQFGASTADRPESKVYK